MAICHILGKVHPFVIKFGSFSKVKLGLYFTALIQTGLVMVDTRKRNLYELLAVSEYTFTCNNKRNG